MKKNIKIDTGRGGEVMKEQNGHGWLWRNKQRKSKLNMFDKAEKLFTLTA